MASYYYLIAQLPYLVYGQNLPFSSQVFKEFVKTKMSKADAELLDCCTIGVTNETQKSTSSEFINAWHKRERALILNLAQYRAAKLKREGSQVNYEPPHEPMDAENQAKTAVTMENPLEAELYLDKGRWDAIENLQGITYFDVNVVYAYLLKLLLIERRSVFKTEEGFAEYKTLYASIMKSAPDHFE